jgi:hypothetical protein
MAKGKRPGSATAERSRHVPAVHSPEGRRTDLLVTLILFLIPFLFYWRYLTGSTMLAGTDWLGAGSCAMREFMSQYIRSHGIIAFWIPGILCGQPTGAGFFADLFYPTMFARLVLPVHVVWAWTFVLHLFLAGLGTFLFLKELKVSVLPAALGGVAYMLAGSLISLTFAGHDGRLIGTALMPLVLFCLHRGMLRRRLVWFLLAGSVMALQLLSGHIQKVYYTGLIAVAYFLFLLISALRTERSAGLAVRLCSYFVVGLGLAVTLSAVQYLPIYGNMPFAARGADRGYEYAASWSMPVVETFDLLTPKFSGGLESYWGKNVFKLHTEYLGILPLLFAFVAVFRRWKDRSVRFFTFSFAGALLMAWGGNTPFYHIPYYVFPGISKFRGPAMIFFVAAFSIVVLAGIGIDYLLRELKPDEARKATRTLFLAGGTPLALLVLFAALRDPMLGLLKSGTLPEPQKIQALVANYPNLLNGVLFAAVVAAVGTLLAWLLLARRIKLVAFTALTAAVMVLDIGLSLNLWNESRGYIRGVPPPQQYFAPDEAAAFLKADTSLFRVLPLNYERSDEGVLLYNGIQSAGGQLPNPLQSYQDLIGAGQSVMFAAGNLMNPACMNVANVKYVISYALPDDVSRYSDRDQQAIAQLRAYFAQPQFEPSFRGQKYAVYRNRDCLPRAFVVPEYEILKTKDEVLSRVMQPGFDPSATALLYASPGFSPGPDSFSGAAEILKYDCNSVAVKTRTSTPALLVLSENWQPDWHATLDGKPVSVLKAFHTFRAVPVPAGEHEVVFRYSSPYYRVGAMLTLGSLAFLVAMLGVTVAQDRRRRPRPARSPKDE